MLIEVRLRNQLLCSVNCSEEDVSSNEGKETILMQMNRAYNELKRLLHDNGKTEQDQKNDIARIEMSTFIHSDRKDCAGRCGG